MHSVGIVGLGYTGLPLAVAFAEAGLYVVGVEKDLSKLAMLNSGESYVEDVSSARLLPLLAKKNLCLTNDYSMLREVEANIICLPTPVDEYQEPDLSIVVEGATSLAENLRPGALVVLQSTTYPGTTREVLLPIFENIGRRNGVSEQAKLQVGENFFLSYCSERMDPGNISYNIQNVPRVAGGITAQCLWRTEELYRRIDLNIHSVSDPETAELTKLLENLFRGVNIALANEMAMLCNQMGLDVWEVIEAAQTKPFGFMAFYPGPGVGGACIPVDPLYLSWRARSFGVKTHFVELADMINQKMPYYAFNRIAASLNSQKKSINGSRILLLGVGFKGNIRDTTESPTLTILDLLRASGAKVAYHDPHVPHLPDKNLFSVELSKEELASSDCIVIATDHDAVDLVEVVNTAPTVLDLRNAIRRRLGKLPENVEVL